MTWLFGSALKSTMVEPERALAGRDRVRLHRPDDPHGPRHPAAGPVARGHRGALRRDGLFLGRRAHLLEDPRRRHDRGRLPGWLHALPDLRGDLHRPDRAHRDGAGRRTTRGRLRRATCSRTFWESHDPTQGYRQGNDVGTQYRSAIYTTTPEQELAARTTRDEYQPRLTAAGFGEITTEIRSADDAGTFYYAEGYHQQYLDKNPNGYCGLGGTGVSCPRPTGA